MSLKAKIEAVIYAAEEPVTLAQLAAIFAEELPAAPSVEHPSAMSLIERGFVEVDNFMALGPELMAEMAEQTSLEEQHKLDPGAEAEAKRAARQRDRDARTQLKILVDGLISDYAHRDRGMEIREVAGGYRIATKPEYHDAVRSFVKSLKPPMKLSLQALETLAVIAYKQPVTAPEVSEIRGVDSGGVLGGLISRKLVTTAGRKQVIGRPILYKTTREFLLRFGLKDVNELPSMEEFEKLAGEMEFPEAEGAAKEAELPFSDSAAADLESVEANAGEPGLAVESAPSPVIEAEPPPPAVIALDAEAPKVAPAESIDVTPPAHPTVPIEETDGRNS